MIILQMTNMFDWKSSDNLRIVRLKEKIYKSF